MLGAIIGDMVGAPYEFDMGDKTKEFELFSEGSQFTDDTVMTVAVAEALMISLEQPSEIIKKHVINAMRDWGKRYPDAGYGFRFGQWLESENPQPYNSWGNGSAMRASAAGWLYQDLNDTMHVARLTAEVTHNHDEGIKGAEATAAAIWCLRNGYSKAALKDFIISEFGYDLSRTCDEIRPTYRHVESCMETVPEAITAFLEGESFEDVIRTAVSLGGDSDTLTCIAGSMAEAFYGIPPYIAQQAIKRLPAEIVGVIKAFERVRISRI